MQIKNVDKFGRKRKVNYRFLLKVIPVKVFKDTEGMIPFGAIVDDDQVKDDEFKYRSLLLNTLPQAQPRSGGYGRKESKLVIQIVRKLKNSSDGEWVTFDDKEWEFIKSYFRSYRQSIIIEVVEDFITDIEELRPEENGELNPQE